jgi:3-phenylpropionate/trans-cinnamate dioxygenase ferredoxin reductase subunit
MKLQIAGIALDHDATVLRGEPDAGPFALFYLRNGVPIAVDCVSSPRDFMQGKKLIAAQRVVPAAALADVQTDLEELLG